MGYRRIIVVILSAALAVTVTGCSILPREEEYNTAAFVKEYEGEEYNLAMVKRGDVRNYQRISCEYRSSNIQNVTLDEWMMVKRINVKVGDKVKEGDVLLEQMSEDIDSNIEETEYQIRLKKAEIRQAAKMQNLEIARQKLVLNDETSIQAIIDSYDAELTRCNSELDSLKIKLNDLKAELSGYQIFANFDGTVTYVNTEFAMMPPWERRGRKDMRVISISDGADPYFAAERNSSECISKLGEGDKIYVAYDDERYETTVHFPDEDYVYFLLDFEPEGIENGKTAVAEYVIEEKLDVLYLPDSAVNKMGDEYVVYYEDENGIKNAKEVQVGLMAGNRAEIISGLEFGDSVIVR